MQNEIRPWGNYTVLDECQMHKVKRIEVLPKQRLSYQYYNHRSETWIITDGIATVTLDGKVNDYPKGSIVNIPLKAKHRVQNNQEKPLIFIEIQQGTYFEEDDIIRIEDDYNRVK